LKAFPKSENSELSTINLYSLLKLLNENYAKLFSSSMITKIIG